MYLHHIWMHVCMEVYKILLILNLSYCSCRNCDSTFGLGSLSCEDDLCWFSSSQATEGSQDALKADAKQNSVPEHCATSRPDSAVPSTIDSKHKSVFLSDKRSSLNMSGDNAGLAHMSSLNVSNIESESKDDLTPNELVSKIFLVSK